MSTIGVMVWIDDSEYERLFGALINFDTFIECEIVNYE